MIIKSRRQAREMAELLQKRLENARRISQDERDATNLDIRELIEFSDNGKFPSDKWSNVYLWLTGSQYSTLE